MANLLIVDDNPGLRDGISTYFEEQGHRSLVASGVSEALSMVRRETPDLVLSDMVMEDGTGLGLRQSIRSLGLTRDPYFILLTGHPTLDNARDAYREGVDLYLTKPFQLPALALAVDSGLKRRPLNGDQVMAASEAFYHDFFLTLNPVLPRLMMMLEGRYGPLSDALQASVGDVIEVWRKLIWTMVDFNTRIRDPRTAKLEKARWHGPAALQRILGGLRKDFVAAELEHEILREPRLPVAWVHAPTAEALLEAVTLRLMAFSAPGSTLSFSWERSGSRLVLLLQTDRMHPRLTPELMRTVALLPPVMPLLENAGVDLRVKDDAGPWRLDFDLQS
jgi:CheY-like chemotaxis protein